MPNIITTATIMTNLRNSNNQNPEFTTTKTIISNHSSGGKILLRSKRFVQRIPKAPKLQDRTRTGPLSGSNVAKSFEPKFGTKNISLVLAALLNNYDYNQRPGYGGPPAVITTNLEIRSMGPISELDMEYSLDCYFRQKWQDERLRFTGNANFLSLNIKMLDKIWKPDTYFHNGKASHLHMITTPNKFLRIFKNGLVLYSMRLTIKSLCPMDLHSFPMDKQSCPLILGSYGFPNDQLVYSWDAKPVTFNQKDFTLSQFDIVKTIYRNRTFRFKRGNHSMLQVNFNLRRHVGYFLIQIYVPCSLIVVLSWVSFWINREATSDRVGLGVTAVLTLSTFGLDSRSDLPRVSYATALDWYTVMCFLFVVFTLLEFAGVHYFTKVGTGEVPIIEIDDDWTKSSGSDEDNDQESSSETNKMRLQNTYRQSNRLRHPCATKSKKTSKFVANYRPEPSIQSINIYKLNNNNNQFQNGYNESSSLETPHLGPIVHMPYCPKYRQQQQQQQQQQRKIANISWVDPYSSSSTMIGSNGDGHQFLKLNSSWPNLAWQNIHCNKSINQLFEHYSIDHLTNIHDYDEDLHQNEKTIMKSSEDDNLYEQSNGFLFCRRILNPLTECCIQFWYCFTANEQYKKEMQKRRTKGQGMCAVNSVSMIDKASRILFPFIFFMLNMAYWTFYINERNTDFIQWE